MASGHRLVLDLDWLLLVRQAYAKRKPKLLLGCHVDGWWGECTPEVTGGILLHEGSDQFDPAKSTTNLCRSEQGEILLDGWKRAHLTVMLWTPPSWSGASWLLSFEMSTTADLFDLNLPWTSCMSPHCSDSWFHSEKSYPWFRDLYFAS